MYFFILFRHIRCTTTTIKCWTLHVIFILFVDHWSYFWSWGHSSTVSNYYFVRWDDREYSFFVFFFCLPLILCRTISINSDAVLDQTPDFILGSKDRGIYSPPFFSRYFPSFDTVNSYNFAGNKYYLRTFNHFWFGVWPNT